MEYIEKRKKRRKGKGKGKREGKQHVCFLLISWHFHLNPGDSCE